MLGASLGAAPGAIVTQESQFKAWFIHAARSGDWRADAAAMYRRVNHDRRFLALWRMHPEARVLDRLSEAPSSPSLAAAVTLDIVDQYAERHGQPDWTTWVDHTPTSMMHVPALLEHFPDSRFVHLVRDGRAVAASVMPLDWGPPGVIHAARWWTYRVAHGLAAATSYPDRVMQLRYEDLTRDPEHWLRRICDFTGLEFTPAMLLANAFDKSAYTSRQHELVGSPITTQKAESWKSKLSAREIELFEIEAGELLRSLGYERETTPAVRRPKLDERLAYWIRAKLNERGKKVRMNKRLEDSIREDEWEPAAAG